MMLAHALACVDEKRVLVIDLDTQCNSSFAMVGSSRWRQAFDEKATLSDYMEKRMRGHAVNPRRFVIANASDVSRKSGAPAIDLLPSSIDLDEDINDAIVETKLPNPFDSMSLYARELLAALDEGYDYILMDCPPGLSPMVNAAIGLAHKVVVPFRADYISQFALDRMANKVEKTGKGARAKKKLDDIPHERRKYMSVVNLHGGTPREARVLEESEGLHPRLAIQLRRVPDIAEAFYWQDEPRTLKEKYGKAEPQVRQFHEEISAWLPQGQRVEA